MGVLKFICKLNFINKNLINRIVVGCAYGFNDTKNVERNYRIREISKDNIGSGEISTKSDEKNNIINSNELSTSMTEEANLQLMSSSSSVIKNEECHHVTEIENEIKEDHSIEKKDNNNRISKDKNNFKNGLSNLIQNNHEMIMNANDDFIIFDDNESQCSNVKNQYELESLTKVSVMSLPSDNSSKRKIFASQDGLLEKLTSEVVASFVSPETYFPLVAEEGPSDDNINLENAILIENQNKYIIEYNEEDVIEYNEEEEEEENDRVRDVENKEVGEIDLNGGSGSYIRDNIGEMLYIKVNLIVRNKYDSDESNNHIYLDFNMISNENYDLEGKECDGCSEDSRTVACPQLEEKLVSLNFEIIERDQLNNKTQEQVYIIVNLIDVTSDNNAELSSVSFIPKYQNQQNSVVAPMTSKLRDRKFSDISRTSSYEKGT